MENQNNQQKLTPPPPPPLPNQNSQINNQPLQQTNTNQQQNINTQQFANSQQPNFIPEQQFANSQQPNFIPEQQFANSQQPNFIPEQKFANSQQPNLTPEQQFINSQQPNFTPEQQFNSQSQQYNQNHQQNNNQQQYSQQQFNNNQQSYINQQLNNNQQQYSQPPQQNFNQQQPSRSVITPEMQVKLKNAGKASVQVGKSGISLIGRFILNPLDVIKKGTPSLALSISIIVLSAIINVWFIDRAIRGCFNLIIFSTGGGSGFDIVMNAITGANYFKFWHYLIIFAIMLLHSLLMLTIFAYLPKLFGSKINNSPFTSKTLGVIAIASLPVMAGNLINSLALTLLNYNIIASIFTLLIFLFTSLFSFMLVYGAMEDFINSSLKRMIIMSIFYSVLILVFTMIILIIIPMLMSKIEFSSLF